MNQETKYAHTVSRHIIAYTHSLSCIEKSIRALRLICKITVFIDLFLYWNIHSFVVYNSVAFSKSTKLFSSQHYIILEHINHPLKKPSAYKTDSEAKITEVDV